MNMAPTLFFLNTIISGTIVAYYMVRRTRHKSAISITLDNDVLDFFAGSGRSGKINQILRAYLRNKLGDDDDSRFEDKTNRQIFAPSISIIQNQFGSDSHEAKIILALFGVIDE